MTFDKNIMAKVKEFYDPEASVDHPAGIKRNWKRYPNSLMDGLGGDIILYCDLITGNSLFPAFEV